MPASAQSSALTRERERRLLVPWDDREWTEKQQVCQCTQMTASALAVMPMECTQMTDVWDRYIQRTVTAGVGDHCYQQ